MILKWSANHLPASVQALTNQTKSSTRKIKSENYVNREYLHNKSLIHVQPNIKYNILFTDYETGIFCEIRIQVTQKFVIVIWQCGHSYSNRNPYLPPSSSSLIELHHTFFYFLSKGWKSIFFKDISVILSLYTEEFLESFEPLYNHAKTSVTKERREPCGYLNQLNSFILYFTFIYFKSLEFFSTYLRILYIYNFLRY